MSIISIEEGRELYMYNVLRKYTYVDQKYITPVKTLSVLKRNLVSKGLPVFFQIKDKILDGRIFLNDKGDLVMEYFKNVPVIIDEKEEMVRKRFSSYLIDGSDSLLKKCEIITI